MDWQESRSHGPAKEQIRLCKRSARNTKHGQRISGTGANNVSGYVGMVTATITTARPEGTTQQYGRALRTRPCPRTRRRSEHPPLPLRSEERRLGASRVKSTSSKKRSIDLDLVPASPKKQWESSKFSHIFFERSFLETGDSGKTLDNRGSEPRRLDNRDQRPADRSAERQTDWTRSPGRRELELPVITRYHSSSNSRSIGSSMPPRRVARNGLAGSRSGL